MVAFGSRSASSGVQQQRRLHNQHAIPPRASERATRCDRARAQRPAADQPAPFDPALLGTAVHPDACRPAVHSSTPEHSAHGAASWLREDEVASRAVQVPLAKANRPVLDARSLARRTELRRACSARGIDYSICDELHELEDRLAGGESTQQASEDRLAGGASEDRLAGGGSAQQGASASAALAQHAPWSTPEPSAQYDTRTYLDWDASSTGWNIPPGTTATPASIIFSPNFFVSGILRSIQTNMPALGTWKETLSPRCFLAA